MLLNHALEETAVSQAQLLKQIRRRRAFSPKRAAAPDSTTLLREDRTR
ncbi:MAG: hypothetical protein KC425_19460 [Anaerolineales bacterium]|nr:hypothetical protein [Anaerolineales bacterium]